MIPENKQQMIVIISTISPFVEIQAQKESLVSSKLVYFVSSCRGKANNFHNSGEISKVGILPWLDFSSPNPCTPHTHAPACREDMSSPPLAPCPCPPSLPATPSSHAPLTSLPHTGLSFLPTSLNSDCPRKLLKSFNKLRS